MVWHIEVIMDWMDWLIQWTWFLPWDYLLLIYRLHPSDYGLCSIGIMSVVIRLVNKNHVSRTVGWSGFWALFLFEDFLSNYRDSSIKIRWPWDHLTFIMGIPILVRHNLYIETDPRYFCEIHRHCWITFWVYAKCFIRSIALTLCKFFFNITISISAICFAGSVSIHPETKVQTC